MPLFARDTTTGLLLDTSAADGPTQFSVPVPALTGTGIAPTAITTSPPSTDLTSTPATSSPDQPSPPSSSSKSSNIPIGAVVAVCIGAFALLLVILLFVFWHLRRQNTQRATDISKRRNFERRKSHHSTWNHLPDATNDGSSDGHSIGMSKGFDVKMSAFPLPPVFAKERVLGSEPKSTALSEKPNDPPQISPLSFETDDHPFNLTPPSPVSNPPPPRPPPLNSPPAVPSSTHPYALATPMYTPVPRTSIMSEASVYSSNLSGANQYDSIISDSSNYPMLSSNLAPESVYSKAFPSSQIAPIPESPNQTVTTPHSHNPFFTAHPSHSGAAEKWGNVGKERVVATPALAPSDSSMRTGGSSMPNNTMENLIAALDLSSTNTSLSVPHPLQRSLRGHLSIAPSEDETEDNPFEFDDVYSQDLASPTGSHHINLFEHIQSVPHSAITSRTFLTDTSADLSGWSSAAISPGAFPMPPR